MELEEQIKVLTLENESLLRICTDQAVLIRAFLETERTRYGRVVTTIDVKS